MQLAGSFTDLLASSVEILNDVATAVAVLGNTGPGNEIIRGPLFENLLINRVILGCLSSCFFLLLKMKILFNFSLRYGALSGLPQAQDMGPLSPLCRHCFLEVVQRGCNAVEYGDHLTTTNAQQKVLVNRTSGR